MKNLQISLSLETLARASEYLCTVDPDLARIHARLGTPPLWERQPGFATLVLIILEQQVSLASARAAFNKLQGAIQVVNPQTFMQLNDDELKAIGFSRQKTSYCRGLALAIQNKQIDLDQLADLEDESARKSLMKIKGIGPWTADIYLLMALLRPDIWPIGDLALTAAVQQVKGLAFRPDPETFDRIARPWKPWRAVAARLLWHHYLS